MSYGITLGVRYYTLTLPHVQVRSVCNVLSVCCYRPTNTCASGSSNVICRYKDEMVMLCLCNMKKKYPKIYIITLS